MSQLIFSCAKTGQAFNTGFEASRDDLHLIPAQWTTRLLCGICHRVHKFEFAGARLCECPHPCRQYGDCHLCKFAR